MSCGFSGVTVCAPAKVNIGLRILPKRTDGFHGVESVFHAVALFDTLKVRCAPGSSGGCTVVCRNLELPADNTLVRAYNAFAAFTGFAPEVRVELVKGIPDGSGLGGGSSDGAAMIRALDEIAETRLSAEEMDRVASHVGSDVFFFLRAGVSVGAAYVTGRGEAVVPIEARDDLALVIVCPPVYCSTVEMFRELDASREAGGSLYGEGGGSPEKHPSGYNEWKGMYEADAASWRFANDFTSCVAVKHPVVGEALADLAAEGSVFASMTGSGSAVFGVFSSMGEAKRVARRLANKWRRCFALPPFVRRRYADHRDSYP